MTRTPQWIEREYGREKWPAVERLIEEEIAAGGSLSQVVARVARREYGAGRALATWGYQGLVAETVVDACEPDTDLVLELGSGWGRNVFFVWLLGGPRDARYAAAEYTESGCRAAARLAGLEPELDLASIRFDYRSPSLEPLRGRRHAVVFSAHSVEQVPELPAGVFDEIRSLAPRITCIHFEPVGWQATGTSDEYAAEHDYNRNLLALAREQEAAKKIEIVDLRVDVVAINPRNPTSVLVWKSAQAS